MTWWEIASAAETLARKAKTLPRYPLPWKNRKPARYACVVSQIPLTISRKRPPVEPLTKLRPSANYSPLRSCKRDPLSDHPCRLPRGRLTRRLRFLPDLVHPLDDLPRSVIPYLITSALRGSGTKSNSRTHEDHRPQSHLKVY